MSCNERDKSGRSAGRRSWVVVLVAVLAFSMGSFGPPAQASVSQTFTSRFEVTGRDDKNYVVTVTVVEESLSSWLSVEIRRRGCKKKRGCWSRSYTQPVGGDEFTIDHTGIGDPAQYAEHPGVPRPQAELKTRFGGANLLVQWRWEWGEFFEVKPSPSVGLEAQHDAITVANPALNFACWGTGTYSINALDSAPDDKERAAPDRLPRPFRKVGTWVPTCTYKGP